MWPKNSDHGFIKDNASGELLWLLVPKATIPADPGVLPTDGEMLDAAEDYVREAILVSHGATEARRILR